MNTSHRSIWNSALGAWVAVSEITRARGKRSGASVALAGSGVLALGLLLAPGVGLAQNYGATGGISIDGTKDGGAAGAAGVGAGGGAAGTTSVSPHGSAGSAAAGGGGGGGYSHEASADVSAPLQGGNGGAGSSSSAGGSGGGGGDGVRINSAGPIAIDAVATVKGGNGGNGSGGNGSGGGGAGVVLLSNSVLTTNAQISGGTGGTGSGGGGGGGAGVILQGAGDLTANAKITGGNGGVGASRYANGNAGVGVLLVGAGSVTTSAAGSITGGSATGVGHGGAGVSMAAGGTIDNAGTIRGGNGGGVSSGGVSAETGGVGSGGASGYISGAGSGGAPGGSGITGAGLSITNSGTIAGGTAGAAQANAITFTGGSNSLTLKTESALTGAIEVGSGATASIVADGIGLAVGNVILGGNASVDTNGNALAVSGVISGAGKLSKTGSGILTLSGANTYSGTTIINAGTLALGAGGSLAATGAVNVNSAGAGFDISAAGNQTIGSLVGATGSTVTLGANTLTFGDASDQTFAGVIGGTGGLVKQGSGMQTLTGVNTYTGGTTINDGTLAIGAGGKLAATGRVNLSTAGASFDISAAGHQTIGSLSSVAGSTVNLGIKSLTTGEDNSSTTYAGAINGTGGSTLYKAGSGTMTLTGTSTYFTTSVNAGTLAIVNGGQVSNTFGYVGSTTGGAATVSGTGSTWTNTGHLVVGNGGTGTLTVSDGGSVVVGGVLHVTQLGGGTGVLNIGGAVGGAAAAAGTVTAGELRFGDVTGSLNFNHTAPTYTFGARITGQGVLNQVAGTTTLTGANTYSGATTINGGTLRVNGSIASSNTTVNSGGTLGGSGTVGNTTIAAGGALAPGNSIGTLTVAGNLSFAPSAIYRVEVDAAGNNDRTNVTGTATLNGTVAVQAAAGSYAANTPYTILNADVLTGKFAGVTSDLAFLDPTLSYDAKNVFLNLARNSTSFGSIAVTPNQIATANALQNASTGASGDMSTVLGTLTGLSATQARAAYDSASGTGLVALRSASAGFASTLNNQMLDRLNTAQGAAAALANSFATRPVLLAANSHGSELSGLLNTTMSDTPTQQFALASGTALPSASASQGRGFWLRGSGGYQDTKSDGNAAASQQRNTALSAGFDTQLQDGLVVGVALNSSKASLSFDNTDAGKSRGTAVAVYGSYAAGPWAFKASASAGWNDNHMERTVSVGALSRVATANFNSNTLSAYGEAVYSLPMQGWTLKPVAALSVSRDKADGFTETGAGALSLQVAGQTITSTKSLLGAKASFEAGRVRLEPRAIWAHEFGDLSKPMTAQFQGAASASPFQVSGVALKRDTLILGLGVSGSIQKNFDLFADVQLEHNARQRNAGLMLGLRVRW